MNVIVLNPLNAVVDYFVRFLHLRVFGPYLLGRSVGKVHFLNTAPFGPILVPRNIQELYIFESPLMICSLFSALLNYLIILCSTLVGSPGLQVLRNENPVDALVFHVLLCAFDQLLFFF